MNMIWKGFHTFVQLLLWTTFVFGLLDPRMMDAEVKANTFFGTYGHFVDYLYTAGSFAIWPIKLFCELTGIYNPEAIGHWFPLTSAYQLHDLLYEPFKGSPMMQSSVDTFLPPDLYPGAFVWWFVIASIVYVIGFNFFNWLFERVRNWFWNMIVEYGFHSKKAKRYAQALEQRQEDMVRMQSSYEKLAHETHSLKDSVITDEMTRVYNKRFFLDRLKQEFDACKQQRQCLSLVMVDIDFFKKLNDNYGHLAGDDVLKEVAAVMKRFTPDLCYACRFGGEEFGIIMPRRTLAESNETARLIQEQVQKLRFPNIDKKLRVTVSQGICTVNFAAADSEKIRHFDDILQLSDQMLYKSKEDGRNRVSTIYIGKVAGPPQKQQKPGPPGQQQMQYGN